MIRIKCRQNEGDVRVVIVVSRIVRNRERDTHTNSTQITNTYIHTHTHTHALTNTDTHTHTARARNKRNTYRGRYDVQKYTELGGGYKSPEHKNE